MKSTFKRIILSIIAFFCISIFMTVYAVEIEVQGEGRAKISGNLIEVQTMAKKDAMKQVVSMAMRKVIGNDAMNNPKIQEGFEDIISQFNVYKIKLSETSRKEGDQYVVTVVATLDDAKFRQVISDMGVAINTAAVRANAILTLMDEFHTVAKDPTKPSPLREITVYKYDHDTSSKEKDSLKATSKASLSANESAQVSARADGAKFDGRDTSSASASQKSSVNYGHFASASDSEHEFFQNIKEYEPQNSSPEKQSLALKELQSAYQKYDIKILDNDRFRSKFFKNEVITIEKMENSKELDRYVKFARDEAHADFFSIGTANLVALGDDPNTGKKVCDGIVAIKVYSTLDGEVIASGALTESASGSSFEQCSAAVAVKIGNGLGEVISNKIQEYWKRRQMYGREYIVLLTGEVSRQVRSQFTNTLSQVPGITNVVQRKSEPSLTEYVISYNGQSALGDAILDHVAGDPNISAAFKDYDATADGTLIKLSPAKWWKSWSIIAAAGILLMAILVMLFLVKWRKKNQ